MVLKVSVRPGIPRGPGCAIRNWSEQARGPLLYIDRPLLGSCPSSPLLGKVPEQRETGLYEHFFFGCRLTTLGAHRFPVPWLRPQADGGRWGRSLSYGFPGRGRLTRGNVGLDPLRKISARGRPWSQVPCGRPGTTRISLGGHYEPRLNSGARCLGLWYDPDRCARGSHRLAGPQTSELELHWAPGVVHWVSTCLWEAPCPETGLSRV